jgi:hypothetical protein
MGSEETLRRQLLQRPFKRRLFEDTFVRDLLKKLFEEIVLRGLCGWALKRPSEEPL